MERFGIPGKTLLGSDSHTPAAGSLGMMAIGAGGLEVALAMAGEPFFLIMPKTWGIKLMGNLPPWVSAKDVILEMLRRHDVKGGVGKIIEYYGPGLANLTAMDRHVIANMGAELGATSTVFPSDKEVRRFLLKQGREEDWVELVADDGAQYDKYDEMNLAELEPLIAKPTSPGNVVPVVDVAGADIYQAYIGSSANPGLRDFGIAALVMDGRKAHDRVSLDINPTSRQILETLADMGLLAKLIHAGARIHQAGCNGCIGMGQAPASGKISLRTTPRNFPGRSGTKEDAVYLCSPETAVASAITGVITDPRTLDMTYPQFQEPETLIINQQMLVAPIDAQEHIELVKGPNIKPLPLFKALSETIEGPVLMTVGDNISTDEIMPAGAKALPFRSNIPEISKFVFVQLDESYYEQAMDNHETGHFIVAGDNYGQGSSREHAALAPRYLGLEAVVARSFARIHWKNLINFGVLPLTFVSPDDRRHIVQGDVLILDNVRRAIRTGKPLRVVNKTKKETYLAEHTMTDQQVEIVLAGGLINRFRQQSVLRSMS
jgi:aconitate hydratase